MVIRIAIYPKYTEIVWYDGLEISRLLWLAGIKSVKTQTYNKAKH